MNRFNREEKEASTADREAVAPNKISHGNAAIAA